MRYARLVTVIGLGLGFIAQGVLAREALSVGQETPNAYKDIENILEKQIPEDLEKAMCGGWQEGTVEGKIAEVVGVPGRAGVWNGAILSGMANMDTNQNGNRNDDFIFPDTTQGLATACAPGKDSIAKKVWMPKIGGFPDEIEEKTTTFPHPQFADPACRWRIKNPDGTFSAEAPNIPLQPLNPGGKNFSYGEMTDADGKKDRQSPENCFNFCVYVNTFVYKDCKIVVAAELVPDPTKPEEVITYPICLQWEQKYICSDAPAPTDAGEVRAAAMSACLPTRVATSIKTNAKSCAGQSCRCTQGGKGMCEKTVDPLDENNTIMPYASYYRRYASGYAREEVKTDGGPDTASNNAQVACYGMYDEFNPFTKQAQEKDRRCVINIDVENYRETQRGKGEYGQNSKMPEEDPRDPNKQENQRNSGKFNADEDLWYQKFSGGFSLLNEKEFDEAFNNNLSDVFLNAEKMDTARMTASTQLKDAPLAKSATVRAFDDTGESRILASWWQKQQNEISALMHPPVIRILLPSGWSFGADPDDPFFNMDGVKILNNFDKRNNRIELQISADEDIVGSAISYIERSLLFHMEEEPIPLLLPMGSSTEFRAKAHAWCMWYIENTGESTCNNAPQRVKDTIKKLEQYADAIDETRALRGELARYAGAILTLQKNLTSPISEWMQSNIDTYRSILQERLAIRQTIGRQWRNVQETYNTLHGETNMPWCMNQRFTSPVYSLLDGWLPSRSSNGAISGQGLPNITIPPAEDIILDFSTIAYMSGSIVIPVLQPIQVRVADEIPWPPAGTEHGITREYPNLPSIANIRLYLQQVANNLPRPPGNSSKIPPLDIKAMTPLNMEELQSQVAKTHSLVMEMNAQYDKFWKSIGPLKPIEASDNGTKSPEQELKEKKEALECMGWSDELCQHVEMDLVERITRIGSRPLVMLNEDYDSSNMGRAFEGGCISQDDVCSPVHPESAEPRHQLEIIGPRTQREFINNVKRGIRQETLPAPIGGIDPKNLPTYDTDVNSLLPIYDVPGAIDLSPSPTPTP